MKYRPAGARFTASAYQQNQGGQDAEKSGENTQGASQLGRLGNQIKAGRLNRSMAEWR
ncbi:hypothetical protein KUV75_00035 [Qipengyuania gaetbuli]|uniref:hypothetical protein n=1 Tax=Qipengyuania gaetbuli TaxID=266952 RepID=UPI001C99BF9E|nr:hypothetical protein [Qipengyuania gaetbuli]MBY6013296.1 hypothetical protein [Qipengyuania gaetbuli]